MKTWFVKRGKFENREHINGNALDIWIEKYQKEHPIRSWWYNLKIKIKIIMCKF